jgi:hypothetical protein
MDIIEATGAVSEKVKSKDAKGLAARFTYH